MQKQAIPVSGGGSFPGRAFPVSRGDGFRQTIDHSCNMKEF